MWDIGYPVVVGIDEVGRGAWAGPLSVGAAVLPRDRRLNGIRDSKMLTEGDRERLFDRVGAWCATWGVGHATQVECDELGMAAAQRLAAQPGHRPAGRRARRGDRRRELGLRLAARTSRRAGDQGRRLLSRRRRRQHPRQGQPRPVDACPGRALPGVGVRQQQGLPVPDPPRRPAGVGAVGDPPSLVGVHGPLRAVDRHPAVPPAWPRSAAVAVRRVRRGGDLWSGADAVDVEGVGEVGDQVARRLDADGQPHEVVGNLQW